MGNDGTPERQKISNPMKLIRVLLALTGTAIAIAIAIVLSPPFHRFREHHHIEVREFAIGLHISLMRQPIIILGDSLTEFHTFPSQICGHSVVNAGIGGLRISDFFDIAPRLLQRQRPFIVVIALGANDRGSIRAKDDYLELVEKLQPLAPNIIGISVAPDLPTINQIKMAAQEAGMEFTDAELQPSDRIDGVHLNSQGYERLEPALVKAIMARCKLLDNLVQAN
jgi:hypothetical protein